MKHARKLATLLLALVVVLSLATTALAEDTNHGQITINETVNGKTYDLFRVFNLTYVGEGPNQKVAYTINTNWADFFTGDGAGYIVDTNTGNLNPITVDGATDYKYINITEANVANFAQAALAYAAAKPADKTVTAVATTTVVTQLPLGYYLVYPVGAGEIKETLASLCSLTSTVPNGSVTVKATYPTIEKEDDAVSADVGRTVTYTIKGKVPDTTGFTTYTYKITDTMSKGLTFKKDVKVTVGGTDVTNACTINYTPNEESATGFELTIPVKDSQNQVGSAITVTYSAVVNENAVAKISKNKAILEYSNDPTDSTKTTKTPADEETVYSSKIVIDKYETGKETTKLAGAKFVLYKEVTTGEGETAVTSKLYYKWNDTNKKVDWVGNKADATPKTTDDKGAASFDGLADGTYYLEETAAPTGYNLLEEPVEVVVNGENTEAKLSVTAKVANNTGALLPSTGGMGTTLFYVLGSILVVGAVVLLVTKKRMSAAD